MQDYAACRGRCVVASELQQENEPLSMTVLIQTETKCRACMVAAVRCQQLIQICLQWSTHQNVTFDF